MWLDIALMHRLGRKAPLDDDIGLAEAGSGVAFRKGHPLGNVRWLFRLGLDTLGEEIVMQQRRIRGHCRFYIDDMRQRFVVDVDQLDRFGRDRRRKGRHRSDGVALVEHFAPRHDIARQITEVHRALADEGLFRADLGKVSGGHDRLDPGERQCLVGIDPEDAGMGLGTALDLAVKHARDHRSAPKLARPVTFSNPIWTNGPGTDNLQGGF